MGSAAVAPPRRARRAPGGRPPCRTPEPRRVRAPGRTRRGEAKVTDVTTDISNTLPDAFRPVDRAARRFDNSARGVRARIEWHVRGPVARFVHGPTGPRQGAGALGQAPAGEGPPCRTLLRRGLRDSHRDRSRRCLHAGVDGTCPDAGARWPHRAQTAWSRRRAGGPHSAGQVRTRPRDALSMPARVAMRFNPDPGERMHGPQGGRKTRKRRPCRARMRSSSKRQMPSSMPPVSRPKPGPSRSPPSPRPAFSAPPAWRPGR